MSSIQENSEKKVTKNPNQNMMVEDIISELNNHISTESDFSFLNELQKEKEQAESVEDKENKGIIAMRKSWSRSILCLIWIIVVFDIVLVLLYGRGKLIFPNDEIIIVVITDNFLKIVGLGYLITSRLFRKIFIKS